MNTQIISPDDLTPEKIEALFRSAMFYIQDRRQTDDGEMICFICQDGPLRILIGTNRTNKLIHLQTEMTLPMKNHQWCDCHWKLLNTLTFKFPMIRPMRTMNSIVFDYALSYQLGILAPSIIDAFRCFCSQAKDAIRICQVFFSVTGACDPKFVEVSADNIDQMISDLIGDGLPDREEDNDQHNEQGEDDEHS